MVVHPHVTLRAFVPLSISFILFLLLAAESPARSLSHAPALSEGVQSSFCCSSLPDSVDLDAIHVRSTRLAEPAHHQPVDVQRIDSTRMSLYSGGSISSVLSRYSGIYVRDNGPGGLATISQRGLSPSQTQVLWEGFPINTPSLGLSDLSVIPAGLFETVEVSPGTPSSAFGGGSLGGAVYLSADPDTRRSHLDLEQSAGAFGQRRSRAGGTWVGERSIISLTGLYGRADNDFEYVNPSNGQSEQRRHNAGRTAHISGRADVRMERTRLYTRFWLHDSFDEIPGTILNNNPQAEQAMSGIRWAGGVETRLSGWRVDTRLFLDEDRFSYDDQPTQTESRFRRGRALANIDLDRPSTGPVQWRGGVSAGREHVRTNNYQEHKERILLDARVSPNLRLFEERLRLTPTVRFDSYSDFGQVVSPSLGINWALRPDQLYLRGMASRDFNPPSFNDLYWIPSGNPDLTAERSWRVESGVVFRPGGEWAESLRVTGYRIWLEDGIYWFPSGGGNWTPDNVEKVDAYGIEAAMDGRHQIGPLDTRWQMQGEWRRSLIAQERFPGDQGVGRQMRYVPEWTLKSSLSTVMEPFSLDLDYRWTGRRYLTANHTSSLDPFGQLDLAVGLRRTVAGADWRLRLSVRNLLDEQYEVVQWYPMPGRHLELALGLRIH